MPIDDKIKLIIKEVDKTSFNLEKLKEFIAENNYEISQQSNSEIEPDLFSNSNPNNNELIKVLESENEILRIQVRDQKILLAEVLHELNIVMKQVSNIEKAIDGE